MTARTAVAFATLVIATAVTEIITGAGLTARIITVGVLAAVIGGGFVLRLIGTGKGQHIKPRGWAEAGERLALPCELTAVIPRAHTEHDPPWEYQAAPVLEPDAVRGRCHKCEREIDRRRYQAQASSGPPEPEPEAYWLAAGTVSDGQVRTLRVDVLPPPVEAILGHPTTEAAVESMFTRAVALKVRALTDGRS